MPDHGKPVNDRRLKVLASFAVSGFAVLSLDFLFFVPDTVERIIDPELFQNGHSIILKS